MQETVQSLCSLRDVQTLHHIAMKSAAMKSASRVTDVSFCVILPSQVSYSDNFNLTHSYKMLELLVLSTMTFELRARSWSCRRIMCNLLVEEVFRSLDLSKINKAIL